MMPATSSCVCTVIATSLVLSVLRLLMRSLNLLVTPAPGSASGIAPRQMDAADTSNRMTKGTIKREWR